MATICKRYNRQGQHIGWQAKVRRKGQKPVSETFRTKAEAEKWANQIEGQAATGRVLDNRAAFRTTLREVLEDYLQVVVPQKKGHQLEFMIRAWMGRDLAHRFIGDIRVADIKAWMRERLAEEIVVHEKTSRGKIRVDDNDLPIVRYRKTIAPKTVRNELAALSAVYTHARTALGMEGLENPVQEIPKGERPQGKPRDRRLSKEENQAILEAARQSENPWVAPAIEFALLTAARRGEIVGLMRRDINFDERWVLARDTKNGTDRKIPLSSRAVEILRELPMRTDGRVFGISADGLTQAFQRIRERAGIGGREAGDGLTFHDLRHEGTSRLFERGLNIMEAATVTGHKTLQQLKRYTHLRPQDIAKKLG